MAYLFGFFFGRTPLIKLSPKKTWEGFIGGGFATVFFGVVFSYFLCQYQFFICPIEYNEAAGRMGMECEPSYLFRPQEYTIILVRFAFFYISQISRIILFLFLIIIISFLKFRAKSIEQLRCIHSCCIHYRWAFSVPWSDHLVVSLLLASNELSKLK